MKKLVGSILFFVLLFAITITPVCAEEVYIDIYDPSKEYDYLCLDKFIEYELAPELDYYPYMELHFYGELYHHYDSDNNLDWAVIYAVVNLMEEMPYSGVICGKYLESMNTYPIFSVGLGIYDAKADEFLSILGVDPSKYDGFEEYVWENIGVPVGDADGDGVLSVLDATFIQQALAELRPFSFSDECMGGGLRYLSDMDRDGERTVLDATAIQLKLAGLE